MVTPTVLSPCAGVDEAGRGAWVGAVYAAAVILPPHYDLPGLTDSKRLNAKQRERLAEQIKAQALAWSVASSDAELIDQVNILQATLIAMREAVAGLSLAPAWVLVDGNHCPTGLPCPSQAVVGGDALHPCICAASILAKTARDAAMLALDAQFPQYGFAQHKGYGTKAHQAALLAHGPCSAHRRSFAPVRYCQPTLWHEA